MYFIYYKVSDQCGEKLKSRLYFINPPTGHWSFVQRSSLIIANNFSLADPNDLKLCHKTQHTISFMLVFFYQVSQMHFIKGQLPLKNDI